ncbi:MAG: hypothetical protein EOO75_00520 [Myxococcales bacterium]|nr:MAG: hypothetical protein EOO75_00520 [Myxococcales bacterium]
MELSRPGMPKAEGQRYAAALNKMALERQIDPLVAVAIVHFESHWLPGQVSEDGEDYGLGQVRARYQMACRGDEDPLGAPSEACQQAKSALLEGVHNIRQMGQVIKANQEFCRAHLSPKAAALGGDGIWLAGYQGYGSPERQRWCQPGDKTRQVLAYHAELLERLGLRKKTPARPAPKAPGAAKNTPGAAKATPHAPAPAPHAPAPAPHAPAAAPHAPAAGAHGHDAAKAAPGPVAKAAPGQVDKKRTTAHR